MTPEEVYQSILLEDAIDALEKTIEVSSPKQPMLQVQFLCVHLINLESADLITRDVRRMLSDLIRSRLRLMSDSYQGSSLRTAWIVALPGMVNFNNIDGYEDFREAWLTAMLMELKRQLAVLKGERKPW